MTRFVFDPPAIPSVPVSGSDLRFPIRRIFCVGRNYAAHAAEMGGEVDREAPWYFMKSAHAYCPSGAVVPYPPGTSNFHHEMELVVAIGAPAFRAGVKDAGTAIFGYCSGLDMTRRDRQQDGKDHRRPWDLGKDIENGAVLAALTPASDLGDLSGRRIQLTVNGQVRQDATLNDMVWSVEEVISHLSHYYYLLPGDLIMTGTPAGVGPVAPGDVIEGTIEGLEPVGLALSEPE